MLAMLNTLLSFYEHDREAFTYVQGFLFKNLTDEELFERAKQRFPHKQMGLRPMFHRQQMLILMKKVLLLTGEEGRYNPNDMTKEARHALGKVALMTNNLLDPKDQGERLSRREGAEDEDRRLRDEFCTQMIPIFELSNPPDVLPALVRNDEYFRIFERMAARGKFRFSDGDSIAERFLKLTGLKLEDYLLMIFAVYANYEVIARQDGAIKQLIDDPGKFNVGVDLLFSQMRFTPEERRAFFRQTSIDVDGLIEACRTVRSRFPLMQQYDFTALRTYPLIYTRDQEDIATCLDASFLAEKISTGVYYTIKLPLEEAAKRPPEEGDESTSKIAANDHKSFLGYWGSVFEVYVNDRLREARSPGLRRFYASPHYDEPPSKSDTEAFDAVLDYGKALVVFEHKGKYLELGAKYSGNRELFIADLKSKNRIGKAVYQFADNLQLVFNNDPNGKRHTFHERDENGNPTKSFALKDSSRVRKIYPVIVHQDFSLRLNCVNLIMNDFFRQEIGLRKVDEDMVRPLTMISVEDLEVLIPYLAAIQFPDVLDEYAKYDDPLMTFGKFFQWFRKKRRTKVRRNEWIFQRSEKIWQDLKEMFVDQVD